MNKRTTVAVSLLAALALSGTIYGVAAAETPAPNPQIVDVKTQVACGTVTVTLANHDTGAYGFEWHTVPWNGGNVGVKSGSMTVAAGATVTHTVHLVEDSYDGKGAFTLGVVFGPNAPMQPFVDLGLVNTDCKPPVLTTKPKPPVDPTTKPAPTTDPKTPPTTVAPPASTPPPVLIPVPVPGAPAVANPQFSVVPNTTSGVNTGDGSLA